MPGAFFLPMGELARVVPVHGTVEGKKMTLDHQTGGMLRQPRCSVHCAGTVLHLILQEHTSKREKNITDLLLQQLTETGDIKLSPALQLCSSPNAQEVVDEIIRD